MTKQRVVKRGNRMRLGNRWRLVKLRQSRDIAFVGTLISTHNFGNKRLAIFSVPKNRSTKS